MDTNFRTYLDKSNFQISALVIRSLVYDEEKYKVLVDEDRLKDELSFYKHIAKTQKPSIISALYPLIYANKSIYSGYEEAIKLFGLIRRKITANQQYGIYLLALIIKNKEITKEDIIDYQIENLDKDEAIKLQKAKVDSIIKYDKIINLIFELLKEDMEYMEIFKSSDSDTNSDDGYKDKLSGYMENLIQGKILPRKYLSKNIQVLSQVFEQKVGTEISCSLIPRGKILKIDKTKDKITVSLETPNTLYQLIKEI